MQVNCDRRIEGDKAEHNENEIELSVFEGEFYGDRNNQLHHVPLHVLVWESYDLHLTPGDSESQTVKYVCYQKKTKRVVQVLHSVESLRVGGKHEH